MSHNGGALKALELLPTTPVCGLVMVWGGGGERAKPMDKITFFMLTAYVWTTISGSKYMVGEVQPVY